MAGEESRQLNGDVAPGARWRCPNSWRRQRGRWSQGLSPHDEGVTVPPLAVVGGVAVHWGAAVDEGYDLPRSRRCISTKLRIIGGDLGGSNYAVLIPAAILKHET